MSTITHNTYIWLFLATIGVFLLSLPINIMDVDATQYASISIEMAENNSFLEIYHRGEDYLDKPPFLFWISALSIKLFGISNFSYKFPAVLIIILGLYATYRFTKLYYTKSTALLAMLVAGCSQAFFLMTNDVKTDGVFTGLLMLTFWQVGVYLKSKHIRSLLFGAICLSCALMTKGPLALIIFLSGFGLHLIINKNWKVLFHPHWLLFIALILLCLLPMCYGLYTQYDLHPEKQVYGLQSPSGIKFFFWTQSFGRITGDIYWNNGLPWHFFLGSILWDFQPWVLIFYTAFVCKVIDIFKKKPCTEYISFGALLFPFIALSMSKFKLPHYVFPLFPFAAIITAQFLEQKLIHLSWKKVLLCIQYLLICVMLIFPIIIFILFFTPNIVSIIIWITTLSLTIIIFIKQQHTIKRLIVLTVISSIGFNSIMNLHFYPNLLLYQSESEAAKYALKHKSKSTPFYYYLQHAHALDVYSKKLVLSIGFEGIKNIKSNTWIFTNEQGKKEIKNALPNTSRVLKTFYDFNISTLKLPFLLKDTRHQQCQKTYLIQIEA